MSSEQGRTHVWENINNLSRRADRSKKALLPLVREDMPTKQNDHKANIFLENIAEKLDCPDNVRLIERSP